MLQRLCMYVASFCSQCFIFFSTYVANVFIWMLHMFSYICCKCFIWMLHIFYNGFKCFSGFFSSVSDACFNCFIVFRRMFQLLHLNISKLGVCSLRWKAMTKSTVCWFVVREKYCSGWKNKLKSINYKTGEHGLDRMSHFPPRLPLPHLGVKHGKRGQTEVVPAGTVDPHVHAQACDSMHHVQQQQVGT
jgi:hypothetical protein